MHYLALLLTIVFFIDYLSQTEMQLSDIVKIMILDVNRGKMKPFS